MRILLDTHTFLWFCQGSDHLGETVRQTIEEDTNLPLLSIVSIWEIAIKVSLGKLHLQQPFETLIPLLLKQNGIELLHVDIKHLFPLVNLPFHHRDPFDRLLIAQAMQERIPIVSMDAVFDSYPIERLW